MRHFVLSYPEANALYLAVWRNIGDQYQRMPDLLAFLEAWETEGKLFTEKKAWSMSDKEIAALRLELSKPSCRLDPTGSLKTRLEAETRVA